MGFLENMRMNSIYPPTQPLNQQPDIIGEYAQRILPLIHGEEDRQHAFGQQLLAQQRGLQQIDEANAAAHPNVQLGSIPGAISPLDTAKLKQGEEHLRDTRDIASGKLGLAQNKEQIDSGNRDARTKIYAFKAMHPGMKIVATKGGNFSAVDPITGKAMDTGVATGSLSQEDAINLTGEQQQNLEGTKQTGRKELEGQRQTGQQSLEEQRQIGRQQLQEDKPISATQQGADYNNKARELKNTSPELGKYIMFNPNGRFEVMSPDNKDGPDEVTYHQIHEKIYGSPGDVALPNESKSDKNKTKPVDKKPDPLGIR